MTLFLETHNVDYLIHIYRPNRAKVIGREGNSPDRKLRYLIVMKLKVGKLKRRSRGRLGSSHPLKKA